MNQATRQTATSNRPFAFRNVILTAAITLACGAAFAQSVEAAAPAHCDKPIAKVMIGNLSCKAASCNNASAGSSNPLAALLAAAGQPNVSGIGNGIKDMMTTALQSSGCFEVMDRESMEEIRKELTLAGKTMETEAADFLIAGSVTQIDMEKTSANFGWGLIPGIGSIGRTTQKASLGLDLRLVSVDTGKVLSTKKIESSMEDSSFGIGGLGFGMGGAGLVGFGGAFSSLKGTSLEKVTSDAIYKATDFLVVEAKKAKGVSL
jgi:curli biogenesis system outer membrane secretion channel CsgG